MVDQSRSARICGVPPHFSPSRDSSTLTESAPAWASSSTADVYLLRSIGAGLLPDAAAPAGAAQLPPGGLPAEPPGPDLKPIST